MGGGLASAQWFIRCALAKGHPERKGAEGDSEEAPFRGWGVGLRVRSGLSAALSQRDIRNAKELWHIQRKPPLGGGGWACECVAVYPLRSRKGTSGTKGGGG